MQERDLLKQFSTILVIPCFNEEKRIVSSDYSEFLDRYTDFFLLFVNDGSTDGTEKTLNEISPGHNRVHVLGNVKNKGKAEAVRQGVLYSLTHYEFDYIGFADADLSTPLGEFISFKYLLQEKPEITIVLGSRVQMLGKQIYRNLYRHWFARIIATLICKILDEPVYDTQCGAKLFRRDYAALLFKEPFISKWLFDVELLARYKTRIPLKFKDTILESAVSTWTEKEDSKLKYRYTPRILLDLLRIRQFYFKK